MNKPLDPAATVTRAEVEDLLYHEADLLTEPLTLGQEFAHVPEGPGLGVELDEEQLRRWRV